MSKVSGSLNSTFYQILLSKIYVAYGAGIPIIQGLSKESSSIFRIICIVLIEFIILLIVSKDMNNILPIREIGMAFIRVPCYACTIPLMKINVKACPV